MGSEMCIRDRNMTMQECYEAIGGNYEDVLGRLHSEALIRRFADGQVLPVLVRMKDVLSA